MERVFCPSLWIKVSSGFAIELLNGICVKQSLMNMLYNPQVSAKGCLSSLNHQRKDLK